jgi:tRNA (guanine-N7-)-methyltransferase
MQRPGSFIEFKTDSREYFLWSLDEIKETRYRVEFQTLNLHKDGGKYLESNFQTDFEKLFMKKGFEINYIRLVKD